MWEVVETPSLEVFKKKLLSYVSGQARWMRRSVGTRRPLEVSLAISALGELRS